MLTSHARFNLIRLESFGSLHLKVSSQSSYDMRASTPTTFGEDEHQQRLNVVPFTNRYRVSIYCLMSPCLYKDIFSGELKERAEPTHSLISYTANEFLTPWMLQSGQEAYKRRPASALSGIRIMMMNYRSYRVLWPARRRQVARLPDRSIRWWWRLHSS